LELAADHFLAKKDPIERMPAPFSFSNLSMIDHFLEKKDPIERMPAPFSLTAFFALAPPLASPFSAFTWSMSTSSSAAAFFLGCVGLKKRI
tara:strand:- start:38 stop:310 length:273 start_codon:yes stop_codon:yes gene_type:complete